MFRKWFRQNGFIRSSVDPETQEAILTAERERIQAWFTKRRLPSNIEVFHGCDRLVPEGVTIMVRVKGVERTTLEPLLDDIDLNGSLRSLFVDANGVRLVFAPLRSTDVYDIALRLLEELIAKASRTPPDESSQGPYR